MIRSILRPGFGVCLCAISLMSAWPLRADDQSRQRLTADFGWKFIKGDMPDASKPDFDDAAWRKLDLPHDWSIEGPYTQSDPTGGGGGSLPTGIGWYRRMFTAPEAWRGKNVMVEFDGVYMNSDVWLNGRLLGHRPFGYIGFEYNLAPHLKFGQTNVISVRVDNSHQPNSRWYSGSGIYRHVWVTVADPLHVSHWGTYVTTPKVSTDSATVRVRTRVQNDSSAQHDIRLITQILNAQGIVVTSIEGNQTLAANTNQELDQTLEVIKPSLWSLASPNLYSVRTTIKSGGQVADDFTTPFGIRDIAYDVNKGFLLNGQPVKMQGMCIHHDAGSA